MYTCRFVKTNCGQWVLDVEAYGLHCSIILLRYLLPVKSFLHILIWPWRIPFVVLYISVGEPCELPYFELDGEILNPGAKQPYYFPSDREYQMSCNEGFVIQLGEGESYLWTCVKGNWTTTAECVGRYQCNNFEIRRLDNNY